MSKKKLLSLLLVGVLATTSLVGCGTASKNDESKGEKLEAEQVMNTILFNPLTFDSSACYEADSSTILQETQEGLVRLSSVDGKDKVEAAGAESWTTSDDGLEWTFKLRKNKWSDGKEVVASQYVDAVKRELDPNNGFRYAFFTFDIKNAEEYYNGKAKADDIGVQAIDDYTLKFTLKEPTPYFLSKLNYPIFQPIRLDIINQYGDTYGKDYTKTVYCGPFKVESYEPQNKMVLVKNDSYWDKDNVKLTKINMTDIKEFATQAQLFESHQLDVTGSTQEYIEKWTQAAKEGKWQASKTDTPQVQYLQFNQKNNGPSGLMGNVKIRKAIGLSVDRDVLTKDMYGRYTPAYGIVPKVIEAGDKMYRDQVEEPLKNEADSIKGDSAKLQALFHEGLKELGKDTSDLKSITLEYITTGQSALDKQRQEWIKQQIENKLGINLKITVLGDGKLFYATIADKKYDFCQSGWNADYNDPMTFLDMWASKSDNNESGYSSKKYDELLGKLNGEKDKSKRLEIYKELEKMLVGDDAGVSPLFYQDTRRFVQNYVKNFQTPVFGPAYEFRWAYIKGKN